jgi:uncharacterized membrane protein YoaK (UPF0700 family)
VAHDGRVSDTAGSDAGGPGLWRGLVRDPDHGPLPVVLLTMTVVTGLVDAVSILSLGRVFVANMTGNVVFVGFALAHAPGFSLAASLSALTGFLVGAGIGGRVVGSFGHRRRTLILIGLAGELSLVSVALIVAAIVGHNFGPAARDVEAALLAISMGIQNSVVRALKVPDLTTTVLTMTLTGIVADIRTQGAAVALRRVLAVLTMLGGAVLGAVLVIHSQPAIALAVAEVLLAAALTLLVSWRVAWN